MYVQLNKSYLTYGDDIVTLIHIDVDDNYLPYQGDNGVWYTDQGLACGNDDDSRSLEAPWLTIAPATVELAPGETLEHPPLIAEMLASIEALEARVTALEAVVAFPIQLFNAFAEAFTEEAEPQGVAEPSPFEWPFTATNK